MKHSSVSSSLYKYMPLTLGGVDIFHPFFFRYNIHVFMRTTIKSCMKSIMDKFELVNWCICDNWLHFSSLAQSLVSVVYCIASHSPGYISISNGFFFLFSFLTIFSFEMCVGIYQQLSERGSRMILLCSSSSAGILATAAHKYVFPPCSPMLDTPFVVLVSLLVVEQLLPVLK